MQFYALAPLIATLGRRGLWIIVAYTLTAGRCFRGPGRVLVGAPTRRPACRRPDRAGERRRKRVAKSHSKNWLACDLLAARRRGNGADPFDRRGGAGLVAVAVIFGMVVAGEDGMWESSALRRQVAGLDRRTLLLDLSRPPAVLSGLRAALLEQAPPWAVAMIATISAVLVALCLEKLVTRPAMMFSAVRGGADMRRQGRQCFIGRRRPIAE